MMWRAAFESDNFVQELDKLWKEVKPLYKELHKYVRNKLKLKYGTKLNANDGLIPAHVLGNVNLTIFNLKTSTVLKFKRIFAKR